MMTYLTHIRRLLAPRRKEQSMNPTLLMLDNSAILVEVLGLLTAVKVRRPHPEFADTQTLLGRVVSPGREEANPNSHQVQEDFLVAFDRAAGLEMLIKDITYRAIRRTNILLAIDPNRLEEVGLAPEDLVGPIPEEWPASSLPPFDPDGWSFPHPVKAAEASQAPPAPAPEPEPEPEPAPAPQITIEYINQRGQGFASRIQIPEGTTLEGLLNLKCVDPKGREIRVLTPSLGEVPPTPDYVLQPNDHVEAVPVEVGVGFNG